MKSAIQNPYERINNRHLVFIKIRYHSKEDGQHHQRSNNPASSCDILNESKTTFGFNPKSKTTKFYSFNLDIFIFYLVKNPADNYSDNVGRNPSVRLQIMVIAIVMNFRNV